MYDMTVKFATFYSKTPEEKPPSTAFEGAHARCHFWSCLRLHVIRMFATVAVAAAVGTKTNTSSASIRYGVRFLYLLQGAGIC